MKLFKKLFAHKPKHDLFSPGDKVTFSQRKTRLLMKRIQRKGRG